MSETVHVTAGHIANGRPEDPCACPIALAIKEQYAPDDIYVSTGSISMRHRGCDLEARLHIDGGRFIYNFDHGQPVEPFDLDLAWEPSDGLMLP